MSAEPQGRLASSEVKLAQELSPGTTLLHGQYRIESYLNSGGFGITYLAKDSLDRLVVLKECFPASMCYRTEDAVRAKTEASQQEFDSVVRHFGQEARRLSSLKHPGIVGIHQVFEDKGTAFMALDFVRGRDLYDVIDDPAINLTPKQIKSILKRVLKAVGYIHDHDVLHRDISPDNILLEPNGNPVLIDFGAAREEASRASRALSQINVVKDGYSPQEFYIAEAEQFQASDLYSLGATFYHLITGAPPPTAHARAAAIASGKPDPCTELRGTIEGFDEHFLGAIDQSLRPNPHERLASAREWLGLIDTAKRHSAALAEAQKDKAVEASISQLVEEANHQAPKQEAPKLALRKKTAPKPAPKRKPMTLDELINAETLAKLVDDEDFDYDEEEFFDEDDFAKCKVKAYRYDEEAYYAEPDELVAQIAVATHAAQAVDAPAEGADENIEPTAASSDVEPEDKAAFEANDDMSSAAHAPLGVLNDECFEDLPELVPVERRRPNPPEGRRSLLARLLPWSRSRAHAQSPSQEHS